MCCLSRFCLVTAILRRHDQESSTHPNRSERPQKDDHQTQSCRWGTAWRRCSQSTFSSSRHLGAVGARCLHASLTSSSRGHHKTVRREKAEHHTASRTRVRKWSTGAAPFHDNNKARTKMLHPRRNHNEAGESYPRTIVTYCNNIHSADRLTATFERILRSVHSRHA